MAVEVRMGSTNERWDDEQVIGQYRETGKAVDAVIANIREEIAGTDFNDDGDEELARQMFIQDLARETDALRRMLASANRIRMEFGVEDYEPIYVEFRTISMAEFGKSEV